jgi:serine/threonine protein phosphatase PrpC
MVTRALGDTALRSAGVIPRPAIATRRITAPGTHLVIATDGIWDVLDVSMAARLSRAAPDPSAAARAVVKADSGAGSHDNLTVVVIAVPRPRPAATRERRADRGL